MLLVSSGRFRTRAYAETFSSSVAGNSDICCAAEIFLEACYLLDYDFYLCRFYEEGTLIKLGFCIVYGLMTFCSGSVPVNT